MRNLYTYFLNAEFEELVSTLHLLLSERLPYEWKIINEDFKREFDEIKKRGYEIVCEGERKIIGRQEKRELRKAIFHPRKEKPIGVDVGIEFTDEKVILIQIKRAARSNRFFIPRGQLLRALQLCTELCECPLCIHLRLPGCSLGCKGAIFYKFCSQFGRDFLKVCEVDYVLGSRASAGLNEFKGIPESDFNRMLWDCQIGCRDLPKDRKDKLFFNYSLLTNRMLFLYEISGVKFPR